VSVLGINRENPATDQQKYLRYCAWVRGGRRGYPADRARSGSTPLPPD